MIIKTKLTNIETGNVIVLSNNLYPIDEHNWSKVASNGTYSLDGTYIVQQSIKKAGQPYTLKSLPDMGWVTKETVNRLKEERDKLGATFLLDYISENGVKQVKVMFDTISNNPIEATPVSGTISPELDDKYLITLKFIGIE